MVTRLSQIKNFYSKTYLSYSSWFALTCCWVFYLYEYILRASPGVITHQLMSDFNISAGSVGTLIAFYYFAYVPLQVPCGVITDRFGPRMVVTCSALLCSVGTLIFANSHTVLIAEIGRFLIGAGSACAYICCLKTAALWFDESKFAFIAGISMMMGTFGGVFGGAPFAILVNSQGWRTAMLIAAMVGLIIMSVAWMVVRDKPKDQKYHVKEGKLLDGLKIIAGKSQNWLIGIYGLMMFLPLCVFAELWGTPYLMQRFNLTNEIASYGGIMVLLGYAVGCSVSSKLSDYWQSRRKVMSLSVTWTFIGFSIVLYAPGLTFNLVLFFMFLSGVASGFSILYFPAVQESNPSIYSATSVGFTNALVMTSGFVFQPMLGALIDYSWDKKLTATGLPLYELKDYNFAFSAVLIAFLLGRLIMFFIKETYHKSR